MKQYRFDVIIIGAGPAGVAAAGTLAGTGLSVAMLEAGVYAGAENWSGCVYFSESLSEEDCFGRKAVEEAPYERRVIRRGTLVHNGLDIVGVEYTDPETYKDCYTVIRPVYDPYFASLARQKGAVLITETTVTSLIRRNGFVVGVHTTRGPLYAGVVFIAEGDASHLVRSEGLEKKKEPHFLQGVKAVVSLPSNEIEKRFGLGPNDGAAYEIIIRNAAIAGRTAKLNVGGFIYTNRDSLSVGYVVPLDNLRKHYRGGHDLLFEWMKGLPYISELTKDARLSAYGAKIIRSGGWKERPVLVENGLAVGGASVGLGIDMPFPNFTGPAAATGLFFGRAVKALLKEGRALDAKGLAEAYIEPLGQSVYGKNARYLADWPAYFSRSSVLFGRTADMLAGGARFLSSGSTAQMGRFLRGHILSLRGMKEIFTDSIRAISALRLWKPIIKAVLNPVTIVGWIANAVKKPSEDPRLRPIMRVDGNERDTQRLPWPAGPFIARLLSGLATALRNIYSNDNVPLQRKFEKAVKAVVRSAGITDIVVLPLYGLWLFSVSVATAISDAFRFYVLKAPVERFLKEPVMAYSEAQRKARNLDAVRPDTGLDAKLARNTYRIDTISHIRTIWPEAIDRQPEMSQTGLWWVCPAKVYMYEAPLMGRGKVTVNFENCIKCESCWRSEPDRVLWGRHTGHRLIYRPESAAVSSLLSALRRNGINRDAKPVETEEIEALSDKELMELIEKVFSASSAFRDAVHRLPPSADLARMTWPRLMGHRLLERLKRLEAVLGEKGRQALASDIRVERESLESSIDDRRLFHALYKSRRLDSRLASLMPDAGTQKKGPVQNETDTVTYEDVIKSFPDRIAKEWEDGPLSEEWKERLCSFILEHRKAGPALIRAMAAASPGLALIASRHMHAMKMFEASGRNPDAAVCSVETDVIEIREGNGVRIKGSAIFAPLGAAKALLIRSGTKGYILPMDAPGLKITPSPAIGFRASGLANIAFDCHVDSAYIMTDLEEAAADHISYLAIALGAGDYLSRRAKEHAASRIQFPDQMLDTEGRDGIAKLGAVKAMIARIEAWRLILETLFYQYFQYFSFPLTQNLRPRVSNSEAVFKLLCSTLSAMAFGPEPGAMAWDAGQVFGGFAYSEDDLLSRFYRDSSLFRFLEPGADAAARLSDFLAGRSIEAMTQELMGGGDCDSLPPLDRLVSKWTELSRRSSALAPQCSSSRKGEAKALVLGLKALLNRIESGMESGHSMEAEAAAAETLMTIAEEALFRAEESAGINERIPAAFTPLEPTAEKSDISADYEAFCEKPGRPHRSGDFLSAVFDRSDRLVPEIQIHDKALRRRWSELSGWFRKNCRDRDWDGLSFERHVERLHRIPDEIVFAVKQNRWLATYIPNALDGLGWRKAEYYILNSSAGIFGDAAICLLIMASTSIGTTPILLGLEEELPRVREELSPLVSDQSRLGEIGSRINRIIKSFDSPNPAWIKKEYEAVMRLVDSRIRRTRVVKYLAANFLKAFYGAGIAGRQGDFGGFMSGLRKAAGLFEGLMPDVHAALNELPRRERFHKLFLRYLGHGGVSAFALTEPTAGSDSGGVKTTARLTSSRLEPMPDGRYRFLLDEKDEKSARFLIDADRVVFTENGAAYLPPDDRPAEIKYDRYDYGADTGVRYYVYQEKACEFHDIAQVRQTHDGLIYEYYTLTGAKMWITNGSIATQFCLYAQTEEGVTGFLVDRHSEGLKVGADERKTGQRGSPTNEISLDAVRVPREAVIGYEGHGQVNALETLNVGRCGLAVVSTALMRKLIDEAMKNIPSAPERDRLLSEASAVLFGSESLAFYLVGLFDRPHESVRMESAIAKYACSEDIHELISLIEHAYGPMGQTEKYLIEKARRDSRILTVYEGTNEVQRFLILKDLISLASDWPKLPEEFSERPEDSRAKTLARWKNRLRRHVKEAAERFGDTAWSDAMLQPALFPLSEMAGEILRLECIYYRMEWLQERKAVLDAQLLDQAGPYASSMLKVAERSAERALTRLERIEQRYLAAREAVMSNMDVPEVRCADAALDRMEEKQTEQRAQISRPRTGLKVLCILRPEPDLSPEPRMSNGRPDEIVWKLDPLDESAAVWAARLKAAGREDIRVDVLLLAGKEHEHLLRSKAAFADRLMRADVSSDDLIAALEVVRSCDREGGYDIIILGERSLSGAPSLAAFIAGALSRPYYTVDGDSGIGIDTANLPAVVAVGAAFGNLEPDISSIVRAACSSVQVIGVRAAATKSRFEMPSVAAVSGKTITTIEAAADFIKAFAASESAAKAEAYRAEIEKGHLPTKDAVWAVIEPTAGKSNIAVLRAARYIAELLSLDAFAFIPAPMSRRPELAGLAKANGLTGAYCMDTKDGILSEKGRSYVLDALMKTGLGSIFVAAEAWGCSFAYKAGALSREKTIGLYNRVAGVSKNSGLLFSMPAYEGRLMRLEEFSRGPAFITVVAEAEIVSEGGAGGFRAYAIEPAYEHDWIAPMPPMPEPTLSQAEVIIDLGYGIRDKDGLELAMELKKRLEGMGLAPMFGATRKVTQDLKLLPLDAQIGQTGVRVSPKLVIALGISGAPQHIDYISGKAEIICFNKDPEAPLMKLNQTRPAPRVHPIAGDLFITVRSLIEKLG